MFASSKLSPGVQLSSQACSRPFRPRLQISCKSKPEEEQEGFDKRTQTASGLAAATLAASILIASAAVPGDALAARSGGRAGGSSFRSAAPRAAPRRSGPSVQNRTYNYNYSPAPALGGYGYGGGYGGGYGFGGGGLSLFPTFVTPIGGGLFQLFFFAIIASTVLGVVRNLFGGRSRRDDEWDD